MIKDLKSKTLFSTTEVAKILGISRSTVFRKVKYGLIQAEQVGKTYLITKEEITRYLRKGAGR